MDETIRYIKFSWDYKFFDVRKERTKSIARHKGIQKYLTKELKTAKKNMQKMTEIN